MGESVLSMIAWCQGLPKVSHQRPPIFQRNRTVTAAGSLERLQDSRRRLLPTRAPKWFAQ